MQLVTGVESVDTKRRQRQITTRRSIEAAAWKLFNAQGYDVTTVDEIVEEVGISQRTFFRYFDSKEAVLFGDWAWQLEDIARLVEAADPAKGPLEAVQSAVLSLAHGVEHDRRAVILRSQLTASSAGARSYYRQAIQPAWEITIANALAARLGGDVDADPRPRTLADAAAGALNASLSIWVAQDCVELLPELTTRSFEVHTNPNRVD